jgi:hypothetical protein
MATSNRLPADPTAERIVRHFQAEGFPGITEALLVRVGVKKCDRPAIDAAFDLSVEQEVAPPVRDFFEIRLYGFFSEIRSLEDAKAAFGTDFGRALRVHLPSLYFDAAPVVIDDALATGTKYDAMLKLADNPNGPAVAILLNDPSSSFFEYLGTQTGYDWQKIIGTLGEAATSFVPGEDLL